MTAAATANANYVHLLGSNAWRRGSESLLDVQPRPEVIVGGNIYLYMYYIF